MGPRHEAKADAGEESDDEISSGDEESDDDFNSDDEIGVTRSNAMQLLADERYARQLQREQGHDDSGVRVMTGSSSRSSEPNMPGRTTRSRPSPGFYTEH